MDFLEEFYTQLRDKLGFAEANKALEKYKKYQEIVRRLEAIDQRQLDWVEYVKELEDSQKEK